MRMDKTLCRVLRAAASALLAAGLASAEVRECVDCQPCGTNADGSTKLCCVATGCTQALGPPASADAPP